MASFPLALPEGFWRPFGPPIVVFGLHTIEIHIKYKYKLNTNTNTN